MSTGIVTRRTKNRSHAVRRALRTVPEREDRAVRKRVRRERDRPRPLPDQRDVLEDERHADRRDQRHESGARRERLIGDALDGRVEEPAADHRNDQRRRGSPATSVAERGVRAEVEDVERDRRRDHPADHEHVAVGEVDQLEDAVDERVAESDERVERAAREPDERELDERAPVLDQVDGEPRDDERDEDEPDRGDDDVPTPAVAADAPGSVARVPRSTISTS